MSCNHFPNEVSLIAIAFKKSKVTLQMRKSLSKKSTKHTWFFRVETDLIKSEIMLIRNGMVWGYWRVGRDIGGSGEKWWDYCIFCFSQQTALAQAVTGVFSTRGCPVRPASTHPKPPPALGPLDTLFTCLWTFYFTAVNAEPLTSYLLHFLDFQYEPGGWNWPWQCDRMLFWLQHGRLGDMQSFNCKQSKMGLDWHQAFCLKHS